MTQYTRKITRQVTNALPTWRANMADTNKVYRITTAIPDSANSALDWPGKSGGAAFPATHYMPYGNFTYGSGSTNFAQDTIAGYASASLIEDDGAHGSMVFGSGGHDVISNHVLRLKLSENTPSFDWWQNAAYVTSDTAGANIYYDQTTYNALASNRKFHSQPSSTGQSATSIGWDGGFPLGLDGWIYPRKMTDNSMGSNAPMGLRYNTVAYIPSSVSGLAGGALVHVRDDKLGAPFSLGVRPADVTDAQWFDAAWLHSGTTRKAAISYRNCITGAWSQLSGVVPSASYYSTDSSQTLYVAASRTLKRVYVSADANGTAGWFYINCASGLASATVTSIVTPGTAISPNRYNSGALTDGNPHGRLLWYWLDLVDAVGGRAKRLVYQDLDNNTQARVSATVAIDIPTSDRSAMAYNASNHSIMCVYQDGAGVIKYTKIALPADPTNTAGYTVTTQTLTFDTGVSVQSLTTMHGKYWVPSLGIFVIPQATHAPLAFRPA